MFVIARVGPTSRLLDATLKSSNLLLFKGQNQLFFTDGRNEPFVAL